MINTEDILLDKGLYALSSEFVKQKWFNGHIGACIICIALFLKYKKNNKRIYNLACEKIDKMMVNNQIKYTYIKDRRNNKGRVEKITDAIHENVRIFSSDGHGIIYGALALQALHMLEYKVPDYFIDNIVKLVQSAQNDTIKRYWNVDDYKNMDVKLSDIPDFDNVYNAALYCLKNQKKITPNTEIDNEFYFFQGSKLHEITHAHALVILDQLGYNELAFKGLNGLRKQIKFNKQKPKGLVEISKTKVYNIEGIEFWENDLRDYHYYKLAYSVFDLLHVLKVQNKQEIMNDISIHLDLLI